MGGALGGRLGCGCGGSLGINRVPAMVKRPAPCMTRRGASWADDIRAQQEGGREAPAGGRDSRIVFFVPDLEVGCVEYSQTSSDYERVG